MHRFAQGGSTNRAFGHFCVFFRLFICLGGSWGLMWPNSRLQEPLGFNFGSFVGHGGGMAEGSWISVSTFQFHPPTLTELMRVCAPLPPKTFKNLPPAKNPPFAFTAYSWKFFFLAFLPPPPLLGPFPFCGRHRIGTSTFQFSSLRGPPFENRFSIRSRSCDQRI